MILYIVAIVWMWNFTALVALFLNPALTVVMINMLPLIFVIAVLLSVRARD